MGWKLAGENICFPGLGIVAIMACSISCGGEQLSAIVLNIVLRNSDQILQNDGNPSEPGDLLHFVKPMILTISADLIGAFN